MTKVIIAGSRGINRIPALRSMYAWAFCNLRPTEIVSGTARGVDRYGEEFAQMSKIPVARFPADWDKYGKRAGYLRNEQMAEYADELLALWDGESRGTKHMIDIMRKKDKPVFVILHPKITTDLEKYKGLDFEVVVWDELKYD